MCSGRDGLGVEGRDRVHVVARSSPNASEELTSWYDGAASVRGKGVHATTPEGGDRVHVVDQDLLGTADPAGRCEQEVRGQGREVGATYPGEGDRVHVLEWLEVEATNQRRARSAPVSSLTRVQTHSNPLMVKTYFSLASLVAGALVR